MTVVDEQKRQRLLEPHLESLRRLDAKTAVATADLREAFETLKLMYQGWRDKLASERELVKAAGLKTLGVNGSLREEFEDAVRSFNAEGDPLPSTFEALLRKFGVTSSAGPHRVYRSDAPTSEGWGATTSRYGEVSQ